MGSNTGSAPPPVHALRERVEELRARVGAACRESGHDPRSVVIVPATKGTDVGFLDSLHGLGFETFGESRIGEFARKLEVRPKYVWDFFGRFRLEDAPLLVRACRIIHSVATREQAAALDSACDAAGREGAVLLQVNVAREPRKQGWTVPAAEEMATHWSFGRLRLLGLMVIGPNDSGPESTRSAFQTGRALFDRIRVSAGDEFAVLSMGMSGDFEEAIIAGSNLIRIGTFLSKGVNPGSVR